MPVRTEPATDPAAPIPAALMVAVGSSEFNDAVAAAVRIAMAAQPPEPAPQPLTVGLTQPAVIQATSLDTTKPGLDDLTVRFTRFCTHQNCGYQVNQEAGFPRKAAEDLHRSGAARIVFDPRLDGPRYDRRAA